MMFKSVYARNILLILEELEYLAPIQLPDLLKSAKKEEKLEKILSSKAPSHLNVFPNPSKGYVIVEYHLEMENTGVVEIKDVNGITMMDIRVSKLDNQVTVDTQNWKPGFYIASLFVDGKSVESCKFTLIK